MTQALYESLQLAPHQLLTLGALTIAIYAHQQDHDYVIFNSHARNGNGLHEEAGAAVLLTTVAQKDNSAAHERAALSHERAALSHERATLSHERAALSHE